MALERLMEFRPRHWRRSRSSRSYPYFPPHITLATFTTPGFTRLHDILPDGLRPAPVYFESIKAGNTYLGALGVNIEKDPAVIKLGKDIVNHMKLNGIEPRQRGFPHMSLFYVDEPEERQLLDRELRTTGRIMTVRQGNGTRALLKYDPNNRSVGAMSGFKGNQIWLVDCNSKDVEAWHVMEKLRLRSPSSSPAPVIVRRASSRSPSLPPPHAPLQPAVVANYANRHSPPRVQPQYVVQEQVRMVHAHRHYVSHLAQPQAVHIQPYPGGRKLVRREDSRRQGHGGHRRHEQRPHRHEDYDDDDDHRCPAWIEWIAGWFTVRRY